MYGNADWTHIIHTLRNNWLTGTQTDTDRQYGRSQYLCDCCVCMCVCVCCCSIDVLLWLSVSQSDGICSNECQNGFALKILFVFVYVFKLCEVYIA